MEDPNIDGGAPATAEPLDMKDFTNTFQTDEFLIFDDGSAEEFDPFQIGNSNTDDSDSKSDPLHGIKDDAKSVGGSTVTSSALPPRFLVKFQVYEEVSSVSRLTDDGSGPSEVHIEGTLMAQAISSDALKNIPFVLVSSSENEEAIEFIANDTYAKNSEDTASKNSQSTLVNIPKEIPGFVKIGTYRVSQNMQHMPMLLEQRIVQSDSKIQIAMQVRSKLANPDDLSEFTIVTFIPIEVDAESVEITTGNGEFDTCKRCISWKMKNLPKGQSFMVSAKCSLKEETSDAEELKFPVMMRCRSRDRISSIEFQAVEADGYPATVTSSIVGQSYRVLHRLN